jgi:hypothetical protein
MIMTYRSAKLPERFWNQTTIGPDGAHYSSKRNLGPCWLWALGLDSVGYAQTRIGSPDGRKLMAHRVAYEALVGPIRGLELDHLCRVRHCVNPAHLEPVDHLTNMSRGAHAMKTRCPWGHEYSVANTRIYTWPDGHVGRFCRACHLEQTREYKRRQRSRTTQSRSPDI